jgi:hypothetical protein
MNEQIHIDADTLADEVARYLDVVEAFREANCEPTWRPESAFRADAKTATALGQHAPTAH